MSKNTAEILALAADCSDLTIDVRGRPSFEFDEYGIYKFAHLVAPTPQPATPESSEPTFRCHECGAASSTLKEAAAHDAAWLHHSYDASKPDPWLATPVAAAEPSEAYKDILAHLVGAASAYRTYADPKRGTPKDAFFSTRANDFDKAVERGRAALATPESDKLVSVLDTDAYVKERIAAAEPVPSSEPVVQFPNIGAVPERMANNPGILALERMAVSVQVIGKIACWDHFAMFDVRDALCATLPAPEPGYWIDKLPYGEGMTAMKSAIRAALAAGPATPAVESSEEEIGAAMYQGNTVSYMYQKAKVYGDTIIRMHGALVKAGFAAKERDNHVEDMLAAALAARKQGGRE